MLQTLIVVVGIALADSANPSTIGPAVVFAMSEHPTRRVLEFSAGALVVNVVGGALLVLGPGQWLVSLIPSPGLHAKHVIEVVAGVVVIAAAAVVWFARRRLAQRALPGTSTGSRGAFATGATVMLVELPTAFPYFAAIAAVVAQDSSATASLLLVVLFNVVFLAPVVALALVVRMPGVRARVARQGQWIDQHWPLIFAATLAIVGGLLVAVGVNGLARQ